MLLHLALTVLVLQRFLRNARRWYWFAVGLHALADWVAVVVRHRVGLVAAEGALTVFALFSLWLILRFRSGPGAVEPAPASSNAGTP